MPILKENKKEKIIYGVWSIEEEENTLIGLLGNNAPEEIKASGKRKQWLASRILLNELLKHNFGIQEAQLKKTERGTPYINGHKLGISISHCGSHAAVCIHQNSSAGIDIEEMSPRIFKIANKFVNEHEKAQLREENQLVQLYQLWCAKEAVFKWYGKGEVDFRKHIEVSFIQNDSNLLEVNFTKTNTKLSVMTELIEEKLMLGYCL